jgi:predicted 3-demethylubiquinone-9 3-methyltransferase (glyoxalase superfamily)
MGQDFLALNGGPLFPHSPAISFVVSCEDQEEIDYYWDALLEGGKPSQCGWLEDKFGVSWQVVPSILGQLTSGTPAQSKAVMGAVMQMVKLDLATLREAFAQAAPAAANA